MAIKVSDTHQSLLLLSVTGFYINVFLHDIPSRHSKDRDFTDFGLGPEVFQVYV